MKFSRGWKYRLEEGLAYKLECKFSIKTKYVTPWFALTTDGWLVLFAGYAWDGATKFPDFDWIKTPSAIHDALHCAIQAGVIPESENDLIDLELEYAIEGNVGKRWLLRFRGWYVRKATNTVDERKGSAKPPKELPRLKNEISLKKFQEMSGWTGDAI